MRKWYCVWLLTMVGCTFHHVEMAPNKNPEYIKGVEPSVGTSAYKALAHTRLASAYLSQGQFGVALQELNKAIEADGHCSHAYGLLGIIQAKLGDNVKADNAFTTALAISPGDPDLMNNYAWFLCHSQRPEVGLKYAIDATKNPLYSTPEKAFINAGLCSEKMNKIQDAINFYEQSLQVQRSNPLALYRLANIAVTYNHYPQAKYYLDQLLDMNYKTPEIMTLMDQVNARLSKNAPAEHL